MCPTSDTTAPPYNLAQEELKTALEFDQKFNYQKAQKHYLKAINYLLYHRKWEVKCEIEKALITEKIGQYIARCELIKNDLEIERGVCDLQKIAAV